MVGVIFLSSANELSHGSLDYSYYLDQRGGMSIYVFLFFVGACVTLDYLWLKTAFLLLSSMSVNRS